MERCWRFDGTAFAYKRKSCDIAYHIGWVREKKKKMCDKVGSACRLHYSNIKEVGIERADGAGKERKTENNTNKLLPVRSIGERNSIYFQ